MKRIKTLTWALVAAGTVALAANLQASIAVGDALNISMTSDVGLSGKVSIDGSSYFGCAAAVFDLNVTDNSQGTSGSRPTLTIQSFCTDVGVAWQNGKSYQADTLATAGGIDGVSPKWSAGLSSIKDAAYIYDTDFYGKTGLNATDYAAIQLAIWKVLYDSAANGSVAASFTSGNFKATGFGMAITEAIGFINQMDTALAKGGLGTSSDLWLDPVYCNSQGLIYQPPPSSNNTGSVPEPSTIVAGALLLLPFGVSAARILRRNKMSND